MLSLTHLSHKFAKRIMPLLAVLVAFQVLFFLLLPMGVSASCGSVGAERACSPAPDPLCEGVQYCLESGEWSNCVNSTSCTPLPPPPAPGESGSTPNPLGVCVPGFQTNCPPTSGCTSATKTCKSDGTWGECVTDPASCSGGGAGGAGGGGAGGAGAGAGGSGDCSGQFCNPIQSKTFADLVQKIANAITAIGIPFVAIFIVWAGFLFVTAQGDEKRLEQAKKTLQWALIGGAIVIGAYALSAAIVNFAKSL